jgi:hypothetical protein
MIRPIIPITNKTPTQIPASKMRAIAAQLPKEKQTNNTAREVKNFSTDKILKG